MEKHKIKCRYGELFAHSPAQAEGNFHFVPLGETTYTFSSMRISYFMEKFAFEQSSEFSFLQELPDEVEALV